MTRETKSMPVQQRAREVIFLQDRLASLAKQIPMPPEDAADRHALAYQLMGLSFHHAVSIASHLERHGSDLAASAFALGRPMLETLQRGWWFALCASDEDAASFISTDQFPGPGLVRLGTAIDAMPPFNGSSFFSRLSQDEWNVYHSFAHGGIFALDAYANRPNLIPDYAPDRQLSLLDNAQRMAGMSTLGMATVGMIYDADTTSPIYRQIMQMGPQLGA